MEIAVGRGVQPYLADALFFSGRRNQDRAVGGVGDGQWQDPGQQREQALNVITVKHPGNRQAGQARVQQADGLPMMALEDLERFTQGRAFEDQLAVLPRHDVLGIGRCWLAGDTVVQVQLLAG